MNDCWLWVVEVWETTSLIQGLTLYRANADGPGKGGDGSSDLREKMGEIYLSVQILLSSVSILLVTNLFS